MTLDFEHLGHLFNVIEQNAAHAGNFPHLAAAARQELNELEQKMAAWMQDEQKRLAAEAQAAHKAEAPLEPVPEPEPLPKGPTGVALYNPAEPDPLPIRRPEPLL